MKLIALTTIVATLLSDLVIGESLRGLDTSIGDNASRVLKEGKSKKTKKTRSKRTKAPKSAKSTNTVNTCGAVVKQTQNCNKFRFNTPSFTSTEVKMNLCYPLTKDQLPKSMVNAESMRTFASPQVLGFSKDLCYDDITEQVFDKFDNMKLTHADSPDAADRASYWNEVRELIALYYLREQDWKSNMVFDQIALVSPEPVTFVFDPQDTIKKSAQHVCCDFPTTHVTDFILGQSTDPDTSTLIGNNTLFDFDFSTMDKEIFQVDECFSEEQIEFVNTKVAMSQLLGWTVNTVSAVAFASKWAGGRARPQEVVWEIHENGKDNFTFGVPDDIVRNIKNMDLTDEFAFTRYKTKGAPQHPSHPAMHSAGSAISSWIQVISDPTDAEIAMAQHYDYSIAYFRTFAGVHYPSDNRAGLQLGRFILGKNGPDFLAESYGCSAETKANIKAHAESKRPDIDWGNYNPPGWKDPVKLSNGAGYTDLMCVNC